MSEGARPGPDQEALRRERQAERRRTRQAASAPPGSLSPAEPDFQAARPRRVDVVSAYRWLLGREPEGAAVVQRHTAAAASVAELRGRLLFSSEFLQQMGAPVPPGLPPDAPAPDIAAADDPAALAEMLRALGRGWNRIGRTAPHWSCLPDRRFLPDRFAANRVSFFATGRHDRALVEGALARNRIPLDRLQRLLDFGCGVGRATLHLAALCPEVTGVDISAAHLEVARGEARARGMDHIGWLRARVDQPMPAGGCDLWFSRRVLQHCPAPLAGHLLELAFAALAPGGVAIFQAVTYGFGYRFGPADAATLGEAPAEEVHVLPQAAIFAAAAAAGLSVLEVQEDPLAGLDRRRWVSHLFVARKAGPSSL